MSKILTIIVPVYNSEMYLRRCLDSLVYQNLSNYEIIAINNGSTDSSESILAQYRDMFPEIFQYYTISHTDYIAPGRNFGISKSKGRYIGFCDSDDYVELDYFKNMVDVAEEHNPDIVYAPFYYYSAGKKQVVHTLFDNIAPADLIMDGNMSTWNKIYRAELVKNCVKQPEDFCFEDYAWFMVVASYSKKVCYQPKPGYYYVIRDNSESTSYASDKTLGLVKACYFSEKHCNTKYLKEIKISNLNRMIYNLSSRWQHYDAFMRYIERARYDMAPADILRLNDDAYATYLDIKQFSPQIVNLLGESDRSDEVCLHGLKYIHIAGIDSFDSRAEYEIHILKTIYDCGGVWVSKDLIIDAPLNMLFYKECLFVYSLGGKISDLIFGAKKGSDVVKDVLDTYSDKHNVFNRNGVSLSDRFDHVLTKRSFKLDGQYCERDGISLYPAHMFIYNIGRMNKSHYPNYHFTHLRLEYDSEYIDVEQIVEDVISHQGLDKGVLKINEQNSSSDIHSKTYLVGKTVEKMIRRFPWNVLYKMYAWVKKS